MEGPIMKIWSYDGPIKGCAVFEYRRFSLSLSTMAEPNEMLIFPSESSTTNLTQQITGRESLRCEISDITEAMRCIDLYIEKGLNLYPTVHRDRSS
jgi:hypothetical protein